MKETENKNMKEIQLRQQLASITVMDHGTEYRLTPEYVHQHMYAAVINTEKTRCKIKPELFMKQFLIFP